MQLVVPITQAAQEAIEGNTGIIPGSTRVLAYEVPLPALPTQEEVWSFTRFHLELPCFFEERLLQETISQDEEETHFQTEAERNAAIADIGGGVTKNTSITQAGGEQGYEAVEEIREANEAVGTLVRRVKTKKVVTRGVLPITAQLVVQLVGTEGVMWSSVEDVPFRFGFINLGPGRSVGTALVDAYTDLQNPISVISGQPLKLRLYWFVPTSVNTRPIFGVVQVGEKNEARPGTFTLFYTSQPRGNYPVGR